MLHGSRPARLLSILILTGLCGQPASADDWTPQHVAKLRSVTAALISPGGSHIAYLLSVPRDCLAGDDKYEDGPNWTELHVINTADGVSRPYITGEVNVEGAAWTPDGQSISFLAKRGKDKNTSLYLLPLSGGEARRILTHKTDINSYSWSPDGKRVAFIAKDETPKATKDLKEKGFSAEVVEEEMLFERAWVAQTGETEVAPRMLDLPGNVSALKWSPAGEQLALALAPTPLIDDEYMQRKVHVVDAQSGKVVVRFDNPGKLGTLAWAPDGKHLAMLSAEDVHDPSDGRLMVGDVAAGTLKDVLPNYPGAVAAIAWQDSSTVMYVADEGVETLFAKTAIDGSGSKVIVPPGGRVMTEFTLSKDGMHAAFVANSPEHPGELFSMNHGDSGPKRLTTSNSWLSDMRCGKCEVVRHKASDGLELEGILIHPVEQARMMYPLILCVHGGPESHERNGWLTNYSRPGQVAAARGYFTFYPNYRGSTGRGVAFSKLGQADEAGKEFDDLVDAVEALAAKYPIDKSKVGVTGGSYGGYATAWCATALSEHFAAGVMFVGISDAISKKSTTDIPNEDFLVHTRSRPWDEDKWDFYLKRSPIYHVKKCKTPLLIMGGKIDTRVHPSQSMELYRFLKSLGQSPVRLVQFPGEGHGNRKAALKLDYNIRMMQWFDHYLKGPGGSPPSPVLDYGIKKKDATTKPADGDK